MKTCLKLGGNGCLQCRLHQTCLVVTFWLAFHCLSVSAQEQFPYRTKIGSQGAAVHSGPGRVHYATDELEPGTEIEVYRHDPEGWLAIRPPEGSFSLVLASDVAVQDDQIARILHDGAQAWVGTRLEAVEQPMWQVRLKQGELLEVLGMVDRQQYDLDQGEPDWLQVAPPAGEFRWVHRSQVEAPRRHNQIHVEQVDVQRSDQNIGASAGPTDRDVKLSAAWETPAKWDDEPVQSSENAASNSAVENVAQASRNAGWKPAKRKIHDLTDKRSQFFAEDPGTQAADPWQTPAVNGQSAHPSTMEIAGDLTPLPSGSLVGLNENQLNEAVALLDMGLTHEMLKTPDQWNLNEIAARVQSIASSPASPQIHARAALLMDRIRRCREIRAGMFASVQNSFAPSQASPLPPNGTQPSAQPQLIGSTPVGSGVAKRSGETHLANQYDAFGFLNELILRGGMGPKAYVLQNDEGEITHYVAPSPGVNLHRYLKQKVGIFGRRGFHQEFQLDHVTADRVVAIDRLRR